MCSSPTEATSLNYTIDLRVETVNQPSLEMRQAIFGAQVGDDCYCEDPTAVQLERKAAALFGKQAGLFVSSATMGNMLAVMVQCNKRGSQVIVGDSSHVFTREQGSIMSIAGARLASLANNSDGTFCLAELRRKLARIDETEPTTQLVIVENTHVNSGGRVVHLDWLSELVGICRDEQVALHMDGARVFNAAVALDLPVKVIADGFDSVSFCLNKGLTAPIGSVLVGSTAFIKEARRLRRLLGGAMTQIGFMAAAGCYALDFVLPSLADDHVKTLRLANAINEMRSPHFQTDCLNVQTNILFVNILTDKVTRATLNARLKTVTKAELQSGITTIDGKGIVVQLAGRDSHRTRAVIYRGVSDIDIDLVLKKLQFVFNEFGEQI